MAGARRGAGDAARTAILYRPRERRRYGNAPSPRRPAEIPVQDVVRYDSGESSSVPRGALGHVRQTVLPIVPALAFGRSRLLPGSLGRAGAGRRCAPRIAGRRDEDSRRSRARTIESSDMSWGRIIGVRTVDAVHAAPGTKAGFKCEECGFDVSLAPSGQGIVLRHAGAQIVCSRCFRPKRGERPALAPGAAEEIAAFLRAEYVQRARN